MLKQIFIFAALFLMGAISYLPASQAAAAICHDIFMNESIVLESAAMDFFVKHLRIPRQEDLARATPYTLKRVRELTPDMGVFWQNAMDHNPNKIKDTQDFLVRSYYNFVNAQKGNGLTPRSATENELFEQILKNSATLRQDADKGVFELKHLMRLLGLRERRSDKTPYPVLFDGLHGLRLATKDKYKNSFKDMRDMRFGQAYNEATMNMIADKYNGAIAIAFRGLVGFDQQFFNSMVSLATARNLLILIKEVNGETDSIPSAIVNHPRVRVITQTIDFGDELRVWGSMVIIPTNKNPLTGLLERMMARVRGQTQIVFATQRSLQVVATEKNNITGPHMVWSTGVFNEPIYPYSNFASSRVSEMASQREIKAGVIFEKTDRNSGPLGRGTPGKWHITNMDWSPGKNDYGPGIADRGMFYPGDGSAPRPISPTGTIPGDRHKLFDSEPFSRAMTAEILDPAAARGAPVKYIREHDLIDGDKISPWDRAGDRARKNKEEGLEFITEINRAREHINDMMHEFPDMRIIISDQDNHHQWINRQLDNPAAIDDPINGPLLVTLRKVRDSGKSVLEYLFRFQKDDDMNIRDPVLRQKTLDANTYVDRPDMIRVLKAGAPFEIEGFNIASHGDKVDRGRRGGSNMDPHAKANDKAVVAHTHEVAIMGFVFNPGMGVRLRSQVYALHGYSAQTMAVINIYPNGGAQLELFDPQVMHFRPDLSVGPLVQHLTSKPFVVPDPNSLVEEGVRTLNNYDRKPVK